MVKIIISVHNFWFYIILKNLTKFNWAYYKYFIMNLCLIQYVYYPC
jgi:hypothetical protein